MPVKTRTGVARTLTISHEAEALLRDMTPSTRSAGWFLSVLITAEWARREERERLRRMLHQVIPEEGQ
jgi:hypothetical protein